MISDTESYVNALCGSLIDDEWIAFQKSMVRPPLKDIQQSIIEGSGASRQRVEDEAGNIRESFDPMTLMRVTNHLTAPF